MLKEIQRDRWLSLALLVGVAALLFLVIRDYGSGMPRFALGQRSSVPAAALLPANQFANLLSGGGVPSLAVPTNQWSAFYTTAFQPPPPKPPPPPPTTRKVELLYLGHIDPGDAPRRAFVKVGETQFVGIAGSNVVADWFIQSVERDLLTLTNRAGETNQLEFRKVQSIQVPVQ